MSYEPMNHTEAYRQLTGDQRDLVDSYRAEFRANNFTLTPAMERLNPFPGWKWEARRKLIKELSRTTNITA